MKPDAKWVLNEKSPALRRESAPVKWPLTPHEQRVADQMVAYVDASYGGDAERDGIRAGIGMAAPQMGLNAQIVYIHLDEGGEERKYLIGNPKIVGESVQKCYIDQGEGCLSVDDEHEGEVVPRNFRVVVEALDLLTGKPVRIEASSLLAVCLQHEIDHLHGKLFYDRAVKNPAPDWFIIRR